MFQRKSFEELTEKMILWSKGASEKLTDFRVGSKIRTLYETVAIVLEEMYDNSYRSAKTLIQENLYSVFGFERLPASYATGNVTFSLGEDGGGNDILASSNILIPAGSLVQTKATQTSAPIKFYTTDDVIFEIGQNEVTSVVVCELSGVIGNVGPNTITDMVSVPAQIKSVKNLIGFTNGLEEETYEEQKFRFQKFLDGKSRGTKESIEYGATTANLKNTSGVIVEQVRDAYAYEDVSNPSERGKVKLYIWNGVGSASSNLITETTKIINGYYDSEGVAVYGYKPAGVIVEVLNPTLINISVKITLLSYDTSVIPTLAEAKSKLETTTSNFFKNNKIGKDLTYSDLFYEFKKIEGIMDIDFVWGSNIGSLSDLNIAISSTSVSVLQQVLYDLP